MDTMRSSRSMPSSSASFNWATTFQPWILQIQRADNFLRIAFQLGHDFSAMDTAAIFRPLLLSEKSRFSRTSLTYTYILMELTLSKRLFRYALTFHAPPRVSDTTQVRETGTFSVPEIHPSGPDGPAGQGACSQIKQFYSYFLMFKSVTVAFSDDQTTVAPRSDSCGVTPIDPALPITVPSSGPRSIIIILS